MRNRTSKTKNSNVFWVLIEIAALLSASVQVTFCSNDEINRWTRYLASSKHPRPSSESVASRRSLHTAQALQGSSLCNSPRVAGVHTMNWVWVHHILHTQRSFHIYTRSCTHTNPTCCTLSQTHAHTHTHTHTHAHTHIHTHTISQVHTISCHPHMHTAHTHTYTHITHTASHFLVEIWKLV